MNGTVFSYSVIDAFCERLFSGNPAAVVWVESPISDGTMRNIAAEFNLSETAFIAPTSDPHRFGLRWFTPKEEVRLCGHATLAAVAYLSSTFGAPARLQFDTLSGVLASNINFEGRIELDFPANSLYPVASSHDWVSILGEAPADTWVAGDDILVVLDSAESVRRLTPNFVELAQINCRGVIVTSASDDSRYTCVSRMFAPRIGISEDPVTGSAHCALAVYWQNRLGISSITGYQASQRGGVVYARYVNDRVILSGEAHRVMEGKLYL